MIVTEVAKANIVQLVKSALYDADKARRFLYGTNDHNTIRRESGAAVFAQQGLVKVLSANAIYTAKADEAGEWDQLEQIVHQYEVFASEVAENLATDHSHQWSDIECDRLFDLAKGTVFEVKLVKE